jgi:hypothetical protein
MAPIAAPSIQSTPPDASALVSGCAGAAGGADGTGRTPGPSVRGAVQWCAGATCGATTIGPSGRSGMSEGRAIALVAPSDAMVAARAAPRVICEMVDMGSSWVWGHRRRRRRGACAAGLPPP